MLRILAEQPELQQQLRDEPQPHPGLHRGDAAAREPDPRQFRLRACPDDGRRRRASRGHDGDGAQRRREPRPAPVRRPGRAPPRPRRTAASTSGSASASTPAPARRSPRAEARVSFERIFDRMADITISERAHGPAGAPPLRVLADLPAPRPRAAAPRVHAQAGRRDRGQDRVGTDVAQCPRRRAVPRRAARVAAAHPPPAVDVATTPEEAEVLREWQRTLHAGRLGRHPLAGRVRRARRVAGADRDLQRGARRAPTRRRCSGAAASASSGRR